MTRKKIDDAMKQRVIEARNKGLSLRKIADQCGISPTTVKRIIKEKEPGETAKRKTDRQRKIEELERRIAEVEKKILGLEEKHIP